MQEIFISLQVNSMYYQVIHWKCKNPMFYADHLLSERLYGSASSKIDTVAEKMLGIGMDPSCVDLPATLKKVFEKSKGLPQVAKENSQFFEAAMQLEKSLLELCKQCDANPDKSVGTKNLIATIADEAEGRIYLLKQRLSK